MVVPLGQFSIVVDLENLLLDLIETLFTLVSQQWLPIKNLSNKMKTEMV